MKKLLMLFLVAGSVAVQACGDGCCGGQTKGKETATRQDAVEQAGYFGKTWGDVKQDVEEAKEKVEGWGHEAKEEAESLWDRFKTWWNNEPTE